jgi:hypothetical protein
VDKRTLIGKFIHTSWANLNIRCGKYRHLQTTKKCNTYTSVVIHFSRKEYKKWCLEREKQILSLSRPSLDRINPAGDYTIENIQVIELAENIRKDKNHYNGYGVCSICKQKKKSRLFTKDRRRRSGRGAVCKSCDSKRNSISTGVK